jgi:hypothetical protein
MSYSKPYWAMLRPTLHTSATLHTAEPYAVASYWATLQPTELHCILFLSYTAPSELRCMHPTELRWIPLNYAAPNWAIPLPTELHCSLLSYASPCRDSPSPCTLQPTELCYNYAAPSDQCCTTLCQGALYWATLHLTELRCTHWAALHPMICCSPFWAVRHPLRASSPLLCYAVPYWAMLQPNWATYVHG